MSLCLSVVSHGQAALANLLLGDLAHATRPQRLILTQNIPEQTSLVAGSLPAKFIANALPLGFGANHNQAFRYCEEEFFCVANPDIRLTDDPFPNLIRCMHENPSIGVIAPRVINPSGQAEDSARHFPSPASLLRKALGGHDGRMPLAPGPQNKPVPVDWNAGMFLVFRASAFRSVGGFDDKFHLYYEDVDICARLWKAGWKVMVCPSAVVVHAAQRASRRQPRYMAWHAASMARFFAKHLWRLPHTAVDRG